MQVEYTKKENIIKRAAEINETINAYSYSCCGDRADFYSRNGRKIYVLMAEKQEQ